MCGSTVTAGDWTQDSRGTDKRGEPHGYSPRAIATTFGRTLPPGSVSARESAGRRGADTTVNATAKFCDFARARGAQHFTYEDEHRLTPTIFGASSGQTLSRSFGSCRTALLLVRPQGTRRELEWAQ